MSKDFSYQADEINNNDNDVDTVEEGSAEEGKTTEVKTEESSADEDKTTEAKTEEGKTEEGKADEDKTTEAKTEEDKTTEAKTEEGKTPETKVDNGKTTETKTDDGKTTEAKTETPKTWQESIKGVDKYEVLKEAGFDEPTIKLMQFRERSGNFKDVLEIMSTDYKSMKPEDLIRMDIEKKNKGLSKKAIDFLYKKEVTDKYYLDREVYEANSEEAEFGAEILNKYAEELRAKYIKEQDELKPPPANPDLDQTNREAEAQRQKAEVGNLVMNNEVTKSLKTSKMLKIGNEKESFNFPVKDVDGLIGTALRGLVQSKASDLKDLNLNLFYGQIAYGLDPEGFLKTAADHYLAVAKKGLQKTMHNSSEKTPGESKQPEKKTNYAYQP